MQAKCIRRLILETVTQAKASHIGSALSIVDILVSLYTEISVRPQNPNWDDRDRFILSKGHACVAVYAILVELGFFPKDELLSYGQDHSRLMNHISHKVPGVEFSTGSLGHGLPFGAGKALSAKRQEKRWRTVVLMSDGELNEGSNWEALMFAAHHKLDNLVGIIDYNKLQSITSVAETLGLEPLVDKLTSFGWSVKEVDGHNHGDLVKAFQNIPWESGKPSMLIAHTLKGKGVSFMENKVEWHYRSPNKEQFGKAIAELESRGA